MSQATSSVSLMAVIVQISQLFRNQHNLGFVHPKTLVVLCKNNDSIYIAVFEGGSDVVSLFLFPKLRLSLHCWGSKVNQRSFLNFDNI